MAVKTIIRATKKINLNPNQILTKTNLIQKMMMKNMMMIKWKIIIRRVTTTK